MSVSTPRRALPERTVERWMRPWLRFIRVEAASGAMLLACTVVALVLANSPVAPLYHAVFETPLRLSLGGWTLDWTVHHWINDALMVVFFFVVGLEIKREFVIGELRDPRKAALPMAAALGGMVVPAAIYLALQLGQPGERGWGIPMATDIAFVVGCLAVLGPRVPHGLKVLLLALAIVDDIGAILVIAIGYSSGVNMGAIAAAMAGFGLCALFNRVGVRSIAAYGVVGVLIWLAFVVSGIHPTVAGVALGLLTPTSALIPHTHFQRHMEETLARVRGAPEPGEAEHRELMRQVAEDARETIPPLDRLERVLHPWVAYGIMPLFALANAGVHLELGQLGHPVASAVVAGLLLGKPIGILLFSAGSVALGLARLPTGVSWPVLFSGSFLAGIGFTMALFIADLALDGPLLDAAKTGVLAGSALAAVIGSGLLLMFLARGAPIEDDAPGRETA